MKRWIRRLLERIEGPLFAPLRARLDVIDERLDEIERRLAEVQGIAEVTAARAAASTEHTMGIVETQSRTARRLREIEGLLGAPVEADGP